MRHPTIGGCAMLVALALLPASAAAQSGAIVGTVSDASGGVLPGVIVEASSSALIEKVRTATTDSQGLFRVGDLRPGVYVVTFNLSGFKPVRRDGIELSAAFTATVNAELTLGTMEETITVSGRAPLVDVRNVTQHTAMTRDLIESLPTAKTMQNLATLVPGVTVHNAGGSLGGLSQDVGGSAGNRNVRVAIHGSNAEDMLQLYDGMRAQSINGTSAQSQLGINTGSVEEIAIETGNLTAEQFSSGVRANVIPKQGGNRFSFYFQGAYTNDTFQANTGVNQTTQKKIWDFNPAVGGPLRRDRLWFFAAFRYWGNDDLPPGLYHDLDLTDHVYTPDLSRPGIVGNWLRSTNVRLTWGLRPNQRISVFADSQQRCACAFNANSTLQWEAATQYRIDPGQLYQGTWNWTASDRLLVEAGISVYDVAFHFTTQPEIGPDVYPARELSTGVNFRAPGTRTELYGPSRDTRASLTYVTGSHNLKVGMQAFWGRRESALDVNNDTILQLLNGTPNSVVQYATPKTDVQKLNMDLGLFVQEQWTVSRRLTMNLGARFDYLHASVPESSHPAVQFVGARNFVEVADVPNWTDFSPRTGVAWDVLGSARTVFKASFGRYLEGISTLIASQADPSNAIVTNATRQWGDTNSDFIPQPAELGPLSNVNFGQAVVTTRFDPSLTNGFGRRIYNWEGSVGIQHEVRPGIAAGLSYHRRWFGNFRDTDNLSVSSTDFDEYCITTPTDPRLPGGGNQRVCGLYDVNPTKFGQVNNLITSSDAFGRPSQVYDGVDANGSVRLGSRVTLYGGVSVGRTNTDRCYVVDSPGALRFCGVSPPLQPNVKIFGTYRLPWWELILSGTFQSMPGPEILANQAVRSADIAPSLGRPLSSGATSTVSIPLIEPGTEYGERLNQLDFRLTRRVNVKGFRVEPQLDVYNLFNANPVLSLNTTYGSAWLSPTYSLPGRLFKFGVQIVY